MIKLIVSDFDGTLMPYGNRGVPLTVKQALLDALGRGVAVAVSSGRTYGELAALLPEFVKDLWFICCDGAYYVKENRVYYERPIARGELRLFDAQSQHGTACVFHAAFGNYAVGALPTDAHCFDAVTVPNTNAIGEKVFKVTTYGKTVKLPPYGGLRMHWDGGPDAMAQYVNRFCDKGAALSDLQMRLMLTKFDTACIGDSGNDIAMMHNAKISVCVGERSQELRRVCNAHTETVEEAFALL